MSDGNDNLQTESIIIRLQDQITELESEKVRLIEIIKSNDLEELLEDEHIVLPEEAICINEIRRLKQLSDSGVFGSEEAKIFDIIAKNYRLIKGLIAEDKSKKKKLSRKELGKLFDIVGSNDS